MNSYLAIPSPKWRESNHFKMLNPAFSPKSRQSGEKKHIEITAQCEGIIEGITEGVKESTVHIVSLKLTEKSIRASQIAEKLNKPYKTLERHISLSKLEPLSMLSQKS